MDGVKFALIAYTYTTNKKLPEDHELYSMINLLRPMKLATYTPEVSKQMKTWVDKVFKNLKGEHKCSLRRFFGLPNTLPRADDYLDEEASAPYMEQLQSDIRIAKEKADVVLFYPHVGGQFNPKPGKFSEYTVKKALEAGADAVLASHSHMVQKAEYRDGVPVAYSLGNFSMSGSSSIVATQMLPHYGLAMHLYYSGAKLEKATVSVLKAVEERGKILTSWPVDELYEALSGQEKEALEADVATILSWVFEGKYDGPTICREYELKP